MGGKSEGSDPARKAAPLKSPRREGLPEAQEAQETEPPKLLGLLLGLL